ncbi:MAG: hypothetical protein K2X39_08335 [Silvanigrellaceae bacterium]|nr:hypothetical protein [Silvanigrellaceae bacterium]
MYTLKNLLNTYQIDIRTWFKTIPECDIPLEIPEFFNAFFSQAESNKVDYDGFYAALKKLTPDVLKPLHIAFLRYEQTYYERHYKQEISEDVRAIPLNKVNRSEKKDLNWHHYKPLLNSYVLRSYQSSNELLFGKQDAHYLPCIFAINTLTLCKKLPSQGQYDRLQFGLPIYPPHYAEVYQFPLLEKKTGIKDSRDYFPFAQKEKVMDGRKQYLILASNGKKILFMKIGTYKPQAVLASKIATLVNKEAFASERLVNNGVTGSRKLSGFVAFNNNAPKIPFQSGMGQIDEILNYVQETDPSKSNFGYCSKDARAPMIKIDFEYCNLTRPLEISTYEINFAEQFLLHPGAREEYQKEKLKTRLQLALLSAELISVLTDKAFLETDNDKKVTTMELISRSNIALQLILNSEWALKELQENILWPHEIVRNLYSYIKEHHFSRDKESLIHSINERIKHVLPQIYSVNFVEDIMTKTAPMELTMNQRFFQEIMITVPSAPLAQTRMGKQ